MKMDFMATESRMSGNLPFVERVTIGRALVVVAFIVGMAAIWKEVVPSVELLFQ